MTSRCWYHDGSQVASRCLLRPFRFLLPGVSPGRAVVSFDEGFELLALLGAAAHDVGVDAEGERGIGVSELGA